LTRRLKDWRRIKKYRKRWR